jgi:polygalacturonase
MYDVRQFGAKGDGASLDTRAIQAAIERCHEKGGGRVYLPPGTYLIGTLFLRSNVRLYLESGAVLLGSRNIADYSSGRMASGAEGLSGASGYLIYGENLRGVGIEGFGTIDGQGRAFWTTERASRYVVKPAALRPRALLHLVKCSGVSVRDVRLANSPCFTVWLLGCDKVNIDGIVIDNPKDGPNTDGLDIDCCRDVRISNCAIDAGDDCIALKSDSARLGERMACENVVVTNCKLSSSACAIRIGYEGDATIRNCCFSNLTIHDTDIGFDIVSIIPESCPPGLTITEGVRVERIVLANVVMDRVNRPIYIWIGNETDREFKGGIRDVLIDNLIATATNACYLGGTRDCKVEDIEIRNMRIAMVGQREQARYEAGHAVWGGMETPYGLLCRDARRLRLNGLHLDWRSATDTWRNQICCSNVDGLEISGFHSIGFERVSASPAICVQDVRDGFIHGCQAARGTDTFVAVGGRSHLSLAANETHYAKQSVVEDGAECSVVVV